MGLQKKLGKILICALLVVMLVINGTFSPVLSHADEHYAVTVLKKLGLYSAATATDAISYFDCALLILMMKNLQEEVLQVAEGTYYSSVSQLSQAQAQQVKTYFSSHSEYGMQSYFGGSAVLLPWVSRPSQMLETKVPSYVIYQAVLAGMGYVPGKDFTKTQEGILEFAAKVGFQKDSILDVEGSTYETLAEIFYEALFLNTKAGNVVLKEMSASNATLAKAVEENGIFEEVTIILPEFTAGVLVSGSGQTGGTNYVEYQVHYAKVTEKDLAAYAELVESGGWTLQATFLEEVTSEESSTLYYTFQRVMQAKVYFAVLALDISTGVLTIWYAY